MSNVPPPSAPIDPVKAVNGPAIGLMVVGGIGAVLQIIGMLMNILGVGVNAAAGGEGAKFGMMNGAVGILFNVIGIIIAGFILFGAMKMKKLQGYGLAMGASIVAMIPCISPCCLLGLPFGIWALVVLMKPDVKAAFTK